MLTFPHINLPIACHAEAQPTGLAQSTFVLMKAASVSPSPCHYCKAALSSVDVLKGDMSTCANIERSTRVVYTWICPQNWCYLFYCARARARVCVCVCVC